MAKHIVGDAKEIPPGKYKIVRVDAQEISIFNVKGKFYAYENRCPHQGAPVCLGEIEPETSSSVVEPILWGRNARVFRCPWHGWQFDLQTGESLLDCNIRLKAYTIKVEDQKLVLDDAQISS